MTCLSILCHPELNSSASGGISLHILVSTRISEFSEMEEVQFAPLLCCLTKVLLPIRATNLVVYLQIKKQHDL